MDKDTCQSARQVVRHAIAWGFANALFTCYGKFSITLTGEGTDGKDLSFSTSREALMFNRSHPPDSPEGYRELGMAIGITKDCQCEECSGTRQLLGLAAPYLREENRQIPGGDALVLVSQFMAGCGSVVTSRKDAAPLVEEFKPFLELLNEPGMWRETPKK